MDKRLNFPNGEVGITNDEIDLMPNANREGLHGINAGISQGADMIISGVNAVITAGTNCVVEDGFVFLNGEMLKVDAATIESTIADLYEFQKVTTNDDPEWDRSYRDLTTNNVYQKNRAVPVNVASISSLSVEGNTMTDVLKTLIQIQPDWTQADNTQPDYIKNKPTIINTLMVGTVSGLNVGGTGSITVDGDVTSAVLLSSSGSQTRLQVNFDSIGTTNYQAVGKCCIRGYKLG